VREAGATAIRRSWLFEQSSRLGPPTASDQTRYALSLDSASYDRGAFSLHATATLDFRILELRVLGARRLFADSSTEYAGKLGLERESFGVEVARYHAISQRHYGRLALGGLNFFPDGTRWLYLSLATGVLPRPDLPWEFRFALNYYNGRIDRSWAVFVASGEVLREWGVGWKGGFSFRWTYMTIGSETPDALLSTQPGKVYEHMGFSLAPEVFYHFSLGELRLAVPLRMYLDRDITKVENNTGPTYYPSDFPVPSAEASFSITF
jgi:hypothetical protein